MTTKTHKLREFRRKNRLTCKQMAELLSVAEPTLRSLENGTRKITAERAVEIEAATKQKILRNDLRPDLFGKRRAA